MAHLVDCKYPCYQIYRAEDGWRWTYYGGNKEEIGVSSEAYASKQGCRHSVTLIQGSAG